MRQQNETQTETSTEPRSGDASPYLLRSLRSEHEARTAMQRKIELVTSNASWTFKGLMKAMGIEQ